MKAIMAWPSISTVKLGVSASEAANDKIGGWHHRRLAGGEKCGVSISA